MSWDKVVREDHGIEYVAARLLRVTKMHLYYVRYILRDQEMLAFWD